MDLWSAMKCTVFYNYLSTAAVTLCPDDAAPFLCDKAAMLRETINDTFWIDGESCVLYGISGLGEEMTQ
jgi:hypothetical protein